MAEFIIGPTGFALDVIGVFTGEGEGGMLDDCIVAPGGSQLNLAYGLNRLGHDVSVIGSYGSGPVGDICKKELEDEGICVSLMSWKQGETYTAFVLTEPQIPRRTIFANTSSMSGQSFLEDTKDYCQQLMAVKEGQYYGMLGVTPQNEAELKGCLNLYKQAKRMGMTTFLEPSEDSAYAASRFLIPLLELVDVFLPGHKELKRLTGEPEAEKGAKTALDMGCGLVACKLGERGCMISHRQGSFWSMGYAVDIKDLTGAGDGFAAGFLHGLAEGWELSAAADFGNRYAASNIMRPGPRGGMLREEEVKKRVTRKWKK